MNLLLSNQACIVSEYTIDQADNLEYECNGVCGVSYENIVETVCDLIQNYEVRRNMDLRSYQWYHNTRR